MCASSSGNWTASKPQSPACCLAHGFGCRFWLYPDCVWGWDLCTKPFLLLLPPALQHACSDGCVEWREDTSGSRAAVCLCNPGLVHMAKRAGGTAIPGRGVKGNLENLLRKSVFHVMCSHILLPGLPGSQLRLLFPRKDFLFWCPSPCVCCRGRISAFRKAAVCLPFSGWDCKAVCQNALVETRVLLLLPIFQKAFRKGLILSVFFMVNSTFFLESVGLLTHTHSK